MERYAALPTIHTPHAEGVPERAGHLLRKHLSGRHGHPGA